MFLLHIKPIAPEHASDEVVSVFRDITESLHITTVPLVFQYIAIYDHYLYYIWDRIKRNLQSDSFHKSCAELKEITYQTVAMLPTPSVPLRNFVQELHPSEKYGLTEVVNVLDDTNIKLMLITIGIRESLKGIPNTMQLLSDKQKAAQDDLDAILQIRHVVTHEEDEKEMAQATRMLAPLLGNNTLMISRYPDFFATVAMEMEVLKNMPAYLHLRVELEHQAFGRIDQFVQPLDCSFVDFMHMTEGRAYTDEILFLLKDTFSSQFPHLVLTTAVMKNALAIKRDAITQL